MTEIITEHPDYERMKPNLKAVRDCIEGEPAVKRERTLYLKHPNMIDQTSPQQVARYDAFLDGAEFDEYPATTLASMLGQMTDGEIEHDLPERLQYLVNDMDGDGMSLAGAVENIYSNDLQVKFHIVVADYRGLTNVDAEAVTLADVKEQNPRAVVKMYNRESLIDWEFKRINGRMQLSLMVLVEQSVERTALFARREVKTYLVLALDENGEYYQQKYVRNVDSFNADGEPIYVTEPSGARLKWLPVEIVVDEEWPAGSLPRRPGYLYPTCMMALHRYRQSAAYKEAMFVMQPSLFSRKWTAEDMEVFKLLNGRDYIATGPMVVNILPNDAEIDIVSPEQKFDYFERYFDYNDKRSRAVGAIINDPAQGADVTATKSVIDNKNSTAVMSMIVKNTEAALKRVILYCGMFEGLWSQDNIEANIDQIMLKLPRKFVKVTMSAEEIRSIRELYLDRLISRAEVQRKLVAGGFTIGDIEQILNELDSEAGAVPLANNQQPL